MTRRFLTGVALFLASRAGAQTLLVGRVVDRTTSEPVAGVVVTAVDQGGKVLIRAVSDRTNGYAIPLRPGISRLQFRRIGYSPASAAIADSVQGRLDIIMVRLPVQLPPLVARPDAQCDPHPDRGAALALWEEARSAMLTSIVARESRPARVSFLHYQARFNRESALPQRVRRMERDSAAQAFTAARSPAALAKHGYVEQTLRGTSFLAPDEVVLYDESFLATHCFTLATAPAGDDSTLGLRFEPSKGRGRIVDVEGFAWLRKNPLDLRSVEFRYTNVDRSQRENAGSIHFKPLPNGISMMYRWRIRNASDVNFRTMIPGVGLSNAPSATMNETGALIERIDWPDGQPYVAELSSASGVVRVRGSEEPIADVLVRLDDTPFAVRTDSAGAFVLRDLLPGTYSLYIGDPALALHGIERPLIRPITIDEGRTVLGRLEIEDRRKLGRLACLENVEGRYTLKDVRGAGAIFGRVLGPTGQPARSRFRAVVAPRNREPNLPPLVITGATDDRGRFRLCDLPEFSITSLKLDDTAPGFGEATVELAADNAYAVVTLGRPKKP